jgi:hypothetical protein
VHSSYCCFCPLLSLSPTSEDVGDQRRWTHMRECSRNGKCTAKRSSYMCRSLTRGVFLSAPTQEISNPAIQNVTQGHKVTGILWIASDKKVVIFPEQGLRKKKQKLNFTQAQCHQDKSKQHISHVTLPCGLNEVSFSLPLFTSLESVTISPVIPKLSCKC